MLGSASKIGCWRRCQKKAFFQYVLDIERVIHSIAPSRGSLIHQCLELHYSGKDWTEPIKALSVDMEAVFDEEREQWMTLADETYRILRGYLQTYREEDKRFNVLATEQHFVLPLPNGHKYEGYIDKIEDEDNDNRLWVVDYKTTGDIPDVTELFMDVPTCMYAKALASGIIKVPIQKGAKVGIKFDHIRTKAPRKPTILKNGTVSKAECVTDVVTYMDTVRAQGLDPKDYTDMLPKLSKHVFFRRAAIPVRKSTLELITNEIVTTMDNMEHTLDAVIGGKDDYEVLLKNSSMFPRTYMNKRCSWDCEYYKLCVGELAGMSVLSIIATDYQKRKGREDDGGIEE